jgi:hypothetical protein
MTASAILQVLIAGIAASIIGYIWYHPRLFGKMWMRFANVTPEMAERSSKRAHLFAVVAIVANVMVASALKYFSVSFGIDDATGALVLAIVVWLGFIVPPYLGQALWEHKPSALVLINVLYWLVALSVTTLIVAL